MKVLSRLAATVFSVSAGCTLVLLLLASPLSECGAEARHTGSAGAAATPSSRIPLETEWVVLAGGSPGSPGILMRSGFGDALPMLGKYLTVHPALTLYGIYPEPIKNYRGFPKTYYVPKFSHSHDHYMETAFYYPFVSTKHLGLWGKELKDTMRAYRRFMSGIVLNHDPALPENQVVLDKNKFLVVSV